jgi:hypothetical protein
MLSRRDFISFQFKPGRDPDKMGDDGQDGIQAIGADFSDEMLFREMMSLGKDPSNMNREQMLHAVLDEMKKR